MRASPRLRDWPPNPAPGLAPQPGGNRTSAVPTSTRARRVGGMSRTALLFPGQGSQTPEMRELVEDERPDLLELVTAIVGEDPFPRAEEGTIYAQPAIFCASLAGLAKLGSPPAELMAGHSLGELAALVAADVLEEQAAAQLVALRGRLMQEAGDRAGDGGMLALLGRGAADHAPALAEAHGLALANDNSPQQVVLSGARSALPSAAAAARELGLRDMELPVTGAFHSPMMATAVPEFEAALADTVFSSPSAEVLSAVTAAPFDDPRRRLAEALTMPVRWRETMLSLQAAGATRFVETGPGRVLIGLAKRTVPDVELVHA